VDLSLDECKALIEKHPPGGWMPTNLYAYGSGDKLLFGVTLRQEPDRPDWDISWSLTPAEYEAQLATRKKRGFRPYSAVGHDGSTGKVLFSVIWVRYS
jgi:hypothetical protein